MAELQAGKPVSIVQNHATLTTAEAANVLGVSRQFLVKLLDTAQIPCHRAGTHRRIYMGDLLKYKAERDSLRRKVLDDLIDAEMADGLYDRQPLSDAEPR